MEWENPVLIDMSGGSRASKKCVNGITPKLDCIGGAVDMTNACWPGGGMPVPLCLVGECEY